MAKQAHITSDPRVAVGERALALCSKEFKVKVTWDDVPKDKPICRECVDVAIVALTEADTLIERVRRQALALGSMVGRLEEAMVPDNFALDVIAEFAEDFRDKQDGERAARELEQRQKSTCTCTWTDAENFVEDPDCPIHGNSSGGADVEVAPPE